MYVRNQRSKRIIHIREDNFHWSATTACKCLAKNSKAVLSIRALDPNAAVSYILKTATKILV